MAKPTKLEALHADVKLVKRAARLAATYWLTTPDASLEGAADFAAKNIAKGSDAQHVFMSVVATLADPNGADWERGQHA